ncbi:MAG: hypothetical protein NKF70_04210 [Methanobacterium sp. ERen5]|nr:MAG: hypothetical protein NKF70_04210 [Methanobacterium sp. ERen5]
MAIKEIPELLAPAGSLNSLIAAVNAGADAVYISGKKFGARKFASNFTKEEMMEGLKFAKLRNFKVYITVNTLMKDFQLKSAIEYIFGSTKMVQMPSLSKTWALPDYAGNSSQK